MPPGVDVYHANASCGSDGVGCVLMCLHASIDGVYASYFSVFSM